MKKLFNKFLAGAITLALVGTMALGISFSKDAKAADPAPVSIGKWSFAQGGQYNPGEPGNEAYITGAAMSSGENITGWLEGTGSVNQTQTATTDATGWSLGIKNNGWDRTWDTKPWRINPWSIKASVNSHMEPEHQYQVTFKAKANKKKYCYVAFGTVVDGHEMAPYAEAGLDAGSNHNTIVLTNSYETFTYKFTNWVSGTDLTTTLMLGCFGTAEGEPNHAYDYAGELIPEVTEEEAKWSGTVDVADFSVVDLTPEKPTGTTEPPLYTTTAPSPTVAPQPTQAPTVKPSPAPAKTLAKVTKVKVKSVKKKTIKVTWKKVVNAKSYQIKVGNKTYKATKNSKKIKNKKFKKGKKVKVKVRAMAAGYKTGAWSKTVKKKLTK